MSDFECLRKIAARILRMPEADVSRDLAASSMDNWDSLTHLRLILAVEEEFQIKFPTKDIPHLTSLNNILDSLGKSA